MVKMPFALPLNCMVISPLTLNLDTVYLSDEQFYQLCHNNREFKFERTAKGKLIIMSPVGGESGDREAHLIADLVIWNRQTQLGYTFSTVADSLYMSVGHIKDLA